MPVVTTVSDEFAAEYGNAMRAFLSQKRELSLQRAYELGRRALDGGQLLLDITHVHSDVLLRALADIPRESHETVIADAATFLAEFLSPFEMTFRGFMEVVTSLKGEIAERQYAEEALKQSERYYKSLIENALDIVTILDASGRVKYTSPSSERVIGYSQTEMVGRNVFEFVHPDDVDFVLEVFETKKSRPMSTATAEFRFRHKNGDWLIMESIGRNLLEDPFVNGIIVNSRDITDRRNLEEIRRKYEFIANASQELMLLVNAEYALEGVNEACCAAFSRNREEIIGRHLAHILGAEAFQKTLKPYIDAGFRGQEGRYEGWFRLPAMGRRFLEVDCSPYRNIQASVTHVVVIMRDATDRKKTEDEVRRSQRQLAEAQRIAHIGSWEWSLAKGTVTYSNEFGSILGLETSSSPCAFTEFLNRTVAEDRSRVQHTLELGIARREPFTMEYRIRRPDGSVGILQTRGEVVLLDSGEPWSVIGTIQDITERELAQQAVKSSELKYRTLFDTSREGLLLLDGTTGAIADVNTFMIDFLGIPRQQFLGRMVWDLPAVSTIPATERSFRQVVDRDSSRFDELELRRADGHILKVEVVTIRYSVNGQPVVQCHLWDITERRRLQEELDRSAQQRAEDLRRFARLTQQAQEEERRRISRELHDDVCQRLTAITLRLNVLEGQVAARKPVGVRELRAVKKEINSLINEVRRISYNLRPLALDHFGLLAGLRQLCGEFEKLHKIHVEFDSDIEQHRRFDPDLETALYRIAQEALSNCARHASVDTVSLLLTEVDHVLTLVVTDRGRGFSLAEHRNDAISDKKHFGLVNMRERAELFGGLLNVESAPGKGTTLRVIVPLVATTTDGQN